MDTVLVCSFWIISFKVRKKQVIIFGPSELISDWWCVLPVLVPALGVVGPHLPPRNHLEKNHGAQLQPAGVGCGGMRHLHAAAQWELHCSPGVAWQHAARGWSLGTGPHFPDWGPCCAGEHGRDRWRTPEASFGPRWPPGRHRGCWHPGSLLLWLLLWCRQRSVSERPFVVEWHADFFESEAHPCPA